jgi:hypothetical protein
MTPNLRPLPGPTISPSPPVDRAWATEPVKGRRARANASGWARRAAKPRTLIRQVPRGLVLRARAFVIHSGSTIRNVGPGGSTPFTTTRKTSFRAGVARGRDEHGH